MTRRCGPSGAPSARSGSTWAAANQLTLSHATCLPRTWQQPEPEGQYRLEPARSLRLSVVDGEGKAVQLDEVKCCDAAGREFAAACAATAHPAIDPLPCGPLTVNLRRAADGATASFKIPAGVTQWTTVWR